MLNQEMQVEERLTVEKEVAVKVAELPPSSLAMEEFLVRYGLAVFTIFRRKKTSSLIRK